MLRTRAPLSMIASYHIPSDLHVLGLPLAFILSQDQTLHCIMLRLTAPDPILSSSSEFNNRICFVFFLYLHTTFNPQTLSSSFFISHLSRCETLHDYLSLKELYSAPSRFGYYLKTLKRMFDISVLNFENRFRNFAPFVLGLQR